MAKLGPWIFTVDREATANAYAGAEKGGVDRCTCSPCRNFRLVRKAFFPPAFLRLLSDLKIDPEKDGEVWHVPLRRGEHLYNGWYHFLGSLEGGQRDEQMNLTNSFSIRLKPYSGSPGLDAFKGTKCIELGFTLYGAPWLLDEPETL
jgi:hypothetical protein